MSDDPKDLFRILYRSRCAIEGSDLAVEEQVERLLAQSKAGNAKNGVTGALMLTASTFVQALEGPAAALEETFERICRDLRHVDVQLLEFSQIPERAFGGWSMSRVTADGAVGALFTHLAPPEVNSASTSEAATRAVELMKTLVRLERPPFRDNEIEAA
jgi:hypothetical protein